VIERVRRLQQLRTLDCCLVVPAVEPGWRKAFVVRSGLICGVCSLPPGAVPPDATLSQTARQGAEPIVPEEAEDLLLLGGFIRRPPPELTVFYSSVDLYCSELTAKASANPTVVITPASLPP
jgi:hypothetical protein